jgi:ABC-2 type transport system permease protein
MLRRRETLMWVFLMPILFIYFIGTVAGGGGMPSTGRRDVLAVSGAENGGVLVDELMRRLAVQHFEILRPATAAEFESRTRRLTIPPPRGSHATFSEAVLARQPQVLTFDTRSETTAAAYERLRINRAMYEVIADLAVIRSSGQEPSLPAFEQVRGAPRSLSVSVRSAGRRAAPPSGFSQSVPGEMVMLTLLVLLTSGSIALVIERDQGLLRRLASAPIARRWIVLGKWTGRMLLALVQIAFAMIAGVVIFGMDWGASWPMVCLVLTSWAAFTASLSVVLGNVVRSPAQMAGLGVMTSLLLAALGGCWWPIEVAPAWMQTLAGFLPTGWTMNAIHSLVNFGDPPSAAWPSVTALGTGALLLGMLASKTFRYE